MTRLIHSYEISDKLPEIIEQLACELPQDVLRAMQNAFEEEKAQNSGLGHAVIDQLLENAKIAAQDMVPMCQDTGYVWVCLEIGNNIQIGGDIFCGVNDAVAKAYDNYRLRKSLVKNALFDRTNSADNTPAFCEVKFNNSPNFANCATLHVMLKGGGSDNASRVCMLTPGSGLEGIKKALLDCVYEKAANACPPLVIGVGIGSTFDKVPGLAKQALLRSVGSAAIDKAHTQLEAELLDLVNSTGLGPGALGGKYTALAVHVNTAPCHIAAMPLAINMGCSALRRGSYEI